MILDKGVATCWLQCTWNVTRPFSRVTHMCMYVVLGMVLMVVRHREQKDTFLGSHVAKSLTLKCSFADQNAPFHWLYFAGGFPLHS